MVVRPIVWIRTSTLTADARSKSGRMVGRRARQQPAAYRKPSRLRASLYVKLTEKRILPTPWERLMVWNIFSVQGCTIFDRAIGPFQTALGTGSASMSRKRDARTPRRSGPALIYLD